MSPDASRPDPSRPDAAVRPDAAIPDAMPQPDAATYRFECDRPPPANAIQPTPPPAYSGGVCPVLVAGDNTITSTGHTRQFILVVPANLSSEEKLPLLFMWHWLGGSPSGFLERGEVQQAADQQRFLAIIPYSEGAMLFGQYNLRWPFDITQSQDRMNEEFYFFDDMLACAEAQFNVNQNCVSTIGVSAGALFNDQLAQKRSNRLASFVSLSGGVGDTIIQPWGASWRPLPGIVLWGGDGPPRQDGIRTFWAASASGWTSRWRRTSSRAT
jgi:poly(3-hydroxybutyrate) depolymerase